MFYLVRSVPLAWCLLGNKTKKLYREGLYRPLYKLMLERNNGDDLEPKILVTDYEKGLYNGAKEVFEECETYGCFFHFRQVWRHS